MMRDHQFRPSAQDPTRCGLRLPTTARWPEPSTQPCWGLAEDHPTDDEADRLRAAYPTPEESA